MWGRAGGTVSAPLQEIAQQERDEAVRQKENLQREVEQLQRKASRLQNLLTKQDAVLGMTGRAAPAGMINRQSHCEIRAEIPYLSLKERSF